MPRLVLIAGLLVAVLGGTGCNSRRVPASGGASGSKPDAARKQAEGMALNAITGAAKAQAKAVPELTRRGGTTGVFTGFVTVASKSSAAVATRMNEPAAPAPAGPAQTGDPAPAVAKPTVARPKAYPRPGSPPVIKERVVSSMPYPTEKEADEDAIKTACDLLQRKFAELDPPVRYRPSPSELLEFLRRDTKTVRPPEPGARDELAKLGYGSNLAYVEYDIEVTADQIRDLRTRDRLAVAIRVLGMLAAVAFAGFLFLRADEWTKGYLTSWLAVGAAALAGGAAAALYFV